MKIARSRQGMTLIEVMVVLVIIAMLAAATGFSVMKSLERARIEETKARARTIQSAVVHYLMDHPAMCPAASELERGDILDSTTDPNDAWGRPFEIECDEATVHVNSSGSDGQSGTADDVGF